MQPSKIYFFRQIKLRSSLLDGCEPTVCHLLYYAANWVLNSEHKSNKFCYRDTDNDETIKTLFVTSVQSILIL